MPILSRESQPHLRHIGHRGDVINLRVVMSNPITQFLRMLRPSREVNRPDDAAILVDVGNCWLAIFCFDKSACHKAHPAEKRGEQNQQEDAELFLHGERVVIRRIIAEYPD